MADTDNTTNGRNGNGNGRKVITSSTLMPLGLVAALLIGFWRADNYLDTRFNEIKQQLEATQTQLVAVDRSLNEQLRVVRMLLSNRWTATHMQLWAQQLKIDNVALRVPPVSCSLAADNSVSDE